MVSWMRKVSSVVTVEVYTICYCLTLSFYLVGTPAVIYTKLCYRLTTNKTLCNDPYQAKHLAHSHPEIESETSLWIMYLNIAQIIPMIFTSMVFGSYIDSRGFTLPLRLSLVGAIISSAWTAVCAHMLPWHHGFLFFTAVVMGVTGGIGGALLTGHAYVIRDSTEATRGVRIAVLHSALAVAFMMGTFTSGLVIDRLGLDWLFIFSAMVGVIGILDVVFRLREPRITTTQQEFISLWKRVKEYAGCITRIRPDSKRLYMHLMMLAFVLSFCAMMGVIDVEYLYLTKEKGMTNEQLGIYMGTGFAITVLGNVLGTYVLNNKIRFRMLSVAIIGLIFSGACYATLAFAHTITVLWISNAFRFLAFLTSIGAKTFISRCVEMTEQGTLMSFMAVIESIFKLFASLIFNSVYAVSISFWPGLALALCALLNVLAIPITVFVLYKTRHSKENHYNHLVVDDANSSYDIAAVNRLQLQTDVIVT